MNIYPEFKKRFDELQGSYTDLRRKHNEFSLQGKELLA
jgi:hypothetical protein